MANLKRDVFWCRYRDSRQLMGERTDLLNRNEKAANLYKSMATRKDCIWDHRSDTRSATPCGGIFNVQYSPDGSLLVAATENKKVLIFSAHNHSLQHEVTNAHKSCVNLVKFLDSRMFATCSDDCTIALWDLRNLSKKLKSLKGHENWVKSLEYDSNNGILLSAAYDHVVNKWDINGANIQPERILKMRNMLRMCLTPDLNKMILSSSDGYLLIIHNLNVSTLYNDFQAFNSDLHLRMQEEYNYEVDLQTIFSPLFNSNKNRIEMISDFPDGDLKGFITSLDIHPYGWAALSRNTSYDESSEWSCVHDIQDYMSPHSQDSSNKTSDELFTENSDKLLENNSQSKGETNHLDSSLISKNHHFIKSNKNRLKFYAQESNENHGFIKELCFSPDGRIICSPFHFGYRLFSYDVNCKEMSDCVEDKTKKLYEIKRNLAHGDYVVTTTFSPTCLQIASACLRGRIVFSYPIL